jgi:hypothetical protein
LSEAIRQGDIPGVQLRYRQLVAVASAQAWEWLTEPAHQVKWLADAVEREGEALLLRRPESQEGERVLTRELVAGRRWVASLERLDAGWEVATPLVFEVRQTAGGSELMVFQSGFERLKLSIGLTEWERYRKRWREAFERLETAIR